jgi:hypothetical protein
LCAANCSSDISVSVARLLSKSPEASVAPSGEVGGEGTELGVDGLVEVSINLTISCMLHISRRGSTGMKFQQVALGLQALFKATEIFKPICTGTPTGR